MNEIKLQYLGCHIMLGTSKGSGKGYDMCNLRYLVPAEASMSNLQTRHEAFGLEQKEKQIPHVLFDDIKLMNIKPMSWVLVEIGIDPENLDRTIITSLKPEHQNSSAQKIPAK